MAVAPASVAENIIILDDDDEDDGGGPQPSHTTAAADITSSSSSSRRRRASHATPLKAEVLPATHITASPFSSAKKEGRVLQVENQQLFDEVRWGGGSLIVYTNTTPILIGLYQSLVMN